MTNNAASALSIRRRGEWWGSGLPLVILMDGNVMGEIADRFGVFTFPVPDSEEHVVEVILDGQRCVPKPIRIAPGHLMKLMYCPPQRPFLSMLMNDYGGQLELDRGV